MSILLFIIILVVLILSHEFGHFIVAKAFGIRVDEFGIGFPPKLKGWKRGETEYTINAIPFGGFVKIFGEDIPEEDVTNENLKDRERSFYFKPFYAKAGVIVAGVVFNFLLAWLLFSFTFMTGSPVPVDQLGAGENAENVHLVVTSVADGGPAEKAGLKPGDTITSIAYIPASGERTAPEEVTPDAVRAFIATHPNQELLLELDRGGEPVLLKVTPENNESLKRAVVGITMDLIGTLQLNPISALWRGAIMTWDVTAATAYGLYDLVRGIFVGSGAFSQVSGPVGIVRIVGDAAQFGWVYLLGLTALISVNLGVLNLIPFPALDGGRFFFLIIEKLKGSPIKPVVANTINAIGFYALILLMLAVTYHDVVKLLR
ncbi:MAG: RIP metalloprotease RseP [Parcubacteria group bacterium RIFOXYD2_FULL_52_8]|nr:MAG: RIP metalloprotease RseP [Parcubacteria group bacterium RIFOXYD2_FULL_52_8]